MKKRISPDRIVNAVKENFKGILSKPLLKNLILVTIAMTMSKNLRINEIARELPVAVSHQKAKQTRLLRYLKKPFPMLDMMFAWSKYALNRTHGGNEDSIIVLIDGVDLKYDYKAFVAALPFRKRAIPLEYKIYTNQQIRDMVYRSENDIIWNFLDFVYETIQKIYPGRKVILVFDRGFADEKLLRYLEHIGANQVMRVPKNCGIVAMEYTGKLDTFGQWGYFKDVLYHLGKRIKVNLFTTENESKKEDPVFLISDMDDLLDLIYRRRMDIEEGFRDLKTLFGFRQLELKKPIQERVEIIFLLAIISMGLLFLLFEKSGYRWSKYYNTPSRKEFSLIHVIKDVISDSWANLRLKPRFSLDNAVFFCVYKN